MAQAIRLALHYGEEKQNLQNIFGEDVGPPLGGVFTVTQGLKTAWNTPLDERGIIGTAIGLALTGSRCAAEVQFVDYIFNSIDLLKQAGMMCWLSQGRYTLPMVLMAPVGGGVHGSIYHSHSFDSWAVRLPGWKIVMPSSPLNAYGLMISAVSDPNPVLYLIPKALLRKKGREKIPGEPENEEQLKACIDTPLKKRGQWSPQWPPVREYKVQIGKAQIVETGSDLTIVSYGRTLNICWELVKEFKKENIFVELIDMLSLYPYDWNVIKKSIQKTKKVLFVNEDTELANFGEHLAHRASRECFYDLFAPPRVIAGKNIPGVGLHPHFEEDTLPSTERIERGVRELIQAQP